ncbi:MAG: zf-HC2 domain-containing protein [Fuerstiella sp.]
MTADEPWQPCPPGTLQEIANTQHSSERRTLITRRALFSGSAAVAGTAAVLLLGRLSPHDGLTCPQTRRLAHSYVDGTLNETLTAQVDQHCNHCRSCHEFLIQLASEAPA